MKKKPGDRILMITATALIGFGSVFMIPVPSSSAEDEFSAEELYEDSELTEEVAEEINARHRQAMSDLEALRAQTQINRESMVNTTTGPQTYFEDVVMPDSTTEAPDGKKTKKTYKYDKDTGAVVPQRLFNNVR